MIRYTTAKGRREATLGQFPLLSLADARIAAAYFRKEVSDGIDPLLEKQEIELPDIETVDQLFHYASGGCAFLLGQRKVNL